MNKLRLILAILLIAVGTSIGLYTRFTNIDLTELRLLIEYPLRWFIVIVFQIGGVLLLRNVRNK